jgi:membrane protease YdiL (CAAX protease family)
MRFFAEQLPWSPLDSLEVLAIAACLAMWLWAAMRWRRGLPVAPYQPRRPVPWRGIDIALVLVFYLATMSAAASLTGVVLGEEASHAPAARVVGKATSEHVVGQLLAHGNVWILLLCGISVVIVAPLAEELFFRVLLQGWLEKLSRRWRPKTPILRRISRYGVGPVVLTSLLFAGLHFRTERPQPDASFLVFMLAADGVARLLAAGFAVGLLRLSVGATAADFGWVPGQTLHDVKVGVATFVAVAIPIYAMQIAFRAILPPSVAPDPLPLFFFALVLGTIYYRTHRIVPIVVIHAVLNGTSLLLVWLWP